MSATILRALQLAVVMWLVGASLASADVQVTMANGRVTVIAKDASVRRILTEWARVSGTTIVNLDRVSGDPVTLELTNLTEEEVLEVLLRAVGGYIAATRAIPAGNLSRFDRIIVMPSGVAPAVAEPAPAKAPVSVPASPQVAPSQFSEVQTRGQGGGGNGGQPQGIMPPVFPGRAVGTPTGSFTSNEPSISQPSGVESFTEPLSPQPNQPTRPSWTDTATIPQGVAAPGMIAPAPPGQNPPRRSPSEPAPDPLRGSAAPGIIVQPPQPRSMAPLPPPPVAPLP